MNCKYCRTEIPDTSVFCCACGKRQEPATRRKRAKAKNTGSVTKLKNRPNRPWQARLTVDYHSIFIGNFATRAEAENAVFEYTQKEKPDLYGITVEQLYELLKKNKFSKLEKRGIENYNTAWNYFDEPIRKTKMNTMKTIHFQQILDNAILAGKSYSTVNKIKTLISQLCKLAMSNDIIDRDYSEYLQMPKNDTEKREPFTKEDLRIMWAHWREDPCLAAILLMCYTGMRTEEFLSLRKEDQTPTMLHTRGSKTEKGKGNGNGRYCPTPYPISEIVESFLQTPGEYLYTSSKGQKLDISNWRKQVYYPTIDKYQISHFVPYSTRNTFSTLALEAGVDKKAITDVVGHEKYSTTADNYTSPDLAWLSKEISKIAENDLV